MSLVTHGSSPTHPGSDHLHFSDSFESVRPGTEPMTDEAPARFGLGKVDGVTTSRHERCHRIGCCFSYTESVRSESRVVGSSQRQHGEPQGWQSVPQGLLRPGSAQAQAPGQSGRAVATPLSTGGVLGQAGEERTRQPSIKESLEVSRSFQRISSLLVGLSSPFSLGNVLYASGDADEDGAADRQVRAGHNVETDTRTHGVPQQHAGLVADRRPDGFDDQVGSRGQVGANRVRSRMAGQVQSHDGVRAFHSTTERSPQAARLGEPVQQHKWGTRAAHLGMEWHVA